MAGFLEFVDYSVHLDPTAAARPVLSEVSLTVARNEVVGLVGESGSGKSTTAKSALRLLPSGSTITGSVTVDGTDLRSLDDQGVRRLRTETAAMIFQDPRTAMNPVRRVGDFMVEQLLYLGWEYAEARDHLLTLLDAVQVSKPDVRFEQYPHELSGGMLQRVAIAAALATRPKLILADEPTSALDVSTQAETMDLLGRLQREYEFAMLFITHDLHLATAVCDRIYVMYAGRIVEEQAGASLFADPRHPYTRGLLNSAPDVTGSRVLRPIPGRPLSLDEPVTGCPFTARCPHSEPECSDWEPVLTPTGPASSAACRRISDLADRSSERVTQTAGSERQ